MSNTPLEVSHIYALARTNPIIALLFIPFPYCSHYLTKRFFLKWLGIFHLINKSTIKSQKNARHPDYYHLIRKVGIANNIQLLHGCILAKSMPP